MAHDGIVTIGIFADDSQYTRTMRSLAENSGRTINRAINAHVQPLGRITGEANEFQRSLAASNARVIAFGASAGAIYAVRSAFNQLVKATVEVERQMTEINAIFQLGGQQLKRFSGELFNISNAYGMAFKEASAAAAEFARQGLTVEETLKRTSAAMALARISNVNMEQAVASTTSILNTFVKESLDAEEVVNRLVAVDQAYAVSSGDLAEALSRVSSSAADANMSLNETIGLITAAKQITARSASTIGNSLKTMFTRLQRPQVIDDLQSVGIQARSASGQLLPMREVLRNLANSYDSLAKSQKSFVAETVGGVYQINTLKAIMRDLGSGMSIVDGAMNAAANSTDFVQKRMAVLNETISSQLVRAGNRLTETFSNIGSALLGGTMRSGLNSFEKLVSTVGNWTDSSKATSGEGVERLIANAGIGALKGAGNLLKGPGAQLIMYTLIKLYQRLEKFLVDSARDLTGVNKAEKQRQATNESVAGWLKVQKDRILDIITGQKSLNTLTQEYVEEMKDAASQAKTIANLSNAIGGKAAPQLPFVTQHAARGFIPNLEIDQARRGGYTAGNIISTTLQNGDRSVNVIANTAEKITRVSRGGKNYDFLFPKENSPAFHDFLRKGRTQTGMDLANLPRSPLSGSAVMATGFVPNLNLSADMIRTIEGLGINTQNDVIRSRNPKYFTTLPESLVSAFVSRYQNNKPSLVAALRSLVTRNSTSGIPADPTAMYDWMRGWMIGNKATQEGLFPDMKNPNAVRVFAEMLAGGQVIQSQDITQRASKLVSLRHADIQKVLNLHGPSFPFITAYDTPGSVGRMPSDRPGYVAHMIHRSDAGEMEFDIPMPIFGHKQGPALMQKWKAIEELMRQEAGSEEAFEAHEVGTARGAFFEKALRAVARKHGGMVGDIGSELDIYGAVKEIIAQTNIGTRGVAGMEIKASAQEAMSQDAAAKIFRTLAGEPSRTIRGPTAKYIPKLTNIKKFDMNTGGIGIIDADKFGEGDSSTAHYQALIYAAVASGKPIRVHYGPMTVGKTTAAETMVEAAGGMDSKGGSYVTAIDQIDSDNFKQFIINKTDRKNLDTGVFGLALSAASQVRAFYHPYSTYEQRREEMVRRLRERNRGKEGANAQAIAYKYDEAAWREYGTNIEHLGKKLGSRVQLYNPDMPFAAHGFVPNLMIDDDIDTDWDSAGFADYPSNDPFDLMYTKTNLKLGAHSSVSFDEDTKVLDIERIYRDKKDVNPWLVLRKFVRQRGRDIGEIAAGTIVGPKIPKVLQTLIQKTQSDRVLQNLKGADLTCHFSPSLLRDEAVSQIKSGEINKTDFKEMVRAMKFLGVTDFKTMRQYDFSKTLASGFVPNLAWPEFPEYTLGKIKGLPVRKSSMGISDDYFDNMIAAHTSKITAIAKGGNEETLYDYLIDKYGEEYGKKMFTATRRANKEGSLATLGAQGGAIWNNLKGFFGEKFLKNKLVQSDLFSKVEKLKEAEKADFGVTFAKSGRTGKVEGKMLKKIGRYGEMAHKFSANTVNWLVGNDDTTTAMGFVPNMAIDFSHLTSLGSYTARMKYMQAQSTMLGKGSSRAVFDIGEGQVVKLAINDKGIAQNYAESSLSDNDNPILSKVFDVDAMGRYIVAEKAKKMNSAAFKKMTGQTFGTFAGEMRWSDRMAHRGGVKTTSSFAEKVKQWALRNNVMPGDLGRQANMGIVQRQDPEDLFGYVRPQPAIIDYGFTRDVARQHYLHRGIGGRFANGFVPNLTTNPHEILRGLFASGTDRINPDRINPIETVLSSMLFGAERGMRPPSGTPDNIQNEIAMARRYASEPGADDYWARRLRELTRRGNIRGVLNGISDSFENIVSGGHYGSVSSIAAAMTPDQRRALRNVTIEFHRQFHKQVQAGQFTAEDSHTFLRQKLTPLLMEIFPPQNVFRNMLTERTSTQTELKPHPYQAGYKTLTLARNSSQLTITPDKKLYVDFLRRNAWMHSPTGSIFEEANPLKPILGLINKNEITGIKASIIGAKIPNIIKQVVELAKGGKFKPGFSVSVNWTPTTLASNAQRDKEILKQAKERSNLYKTSGKRPSFNEYDFHSISGFMTDEDEAKMNEAMAYFGHGPTSAPFLYDKTFSNGFVPNLYGPIAAAMMRENAATGGKAAIGIDPRLRTSFNPIGFAAYDTGSQSNVSEAIDQHMALGQPMSKVRTAHTARGFVPNLAMTPEPTVDTGGFFSSNSIMSSLMMAMVSFRGENAGPSDKSDKAITSGKFRMFYTEMEKAAANLRILERTFVEARNKLETGETVTAGGRTFRQGDMEKFDTHIKDILSPLKEGMAPFLAKQQTQQEKYSKFGLRASVTAGFGGGIVSQFVSGYGGDKAASASQAIDELSAGASTAAQFLLAFPNKFGKIGAWSIAAGTVSSAADVLYKGIGNARKAFETNTAKFQALTSQIDAMLQSLNQYDTLITDTSVSFEAIKREQRKFSETLATMADSGIAGQKIAARVMGAPDTKTRMSALVEERGRLEREQNLRGSGLALQEYGSRRTFGMGLSRHLGINPFGFNSKAQQTELNNLLRGSANSAIADMADDLKKYLATSSSPEDFVQKLNAAASQTDLPEVAESAQRVINAFSGVADMVGGQQNMKPLNAQMLKQLISEEEAGTPDQLEQQRQLRARNAQRQIQLETASNLARSRTRMFVNTGAAQVGFQLDRRTIENMRRLNTAMVLGPNSVSQRQLNAGLIRQQYGERTVKAYETATEVYRIRTEMGSKIEGVQIDASRSVTEGLRRTFESLIKSPEQFKEAWKSGAALPTASTFDVQYVSTLNKAISSSLAKMDLTKFTGTGGVDTEGMAKAIMESSGADKSMKESMTRFLQVTLTDSSVFQSLLDANKQILQAQEEGNVEIEKQTQQFIALKAEMRFKEMANYLGGIKSLMDRGSRRTMERNLSRATFMMERGRTPEAKAMGGALFLQTMKEMNIPIEINKNTPLSKMMRRAWDMGTTNMATVQSQMIGRTVGSVGRLTGGGSLASVAMRELASRGGIANTEASFKQAFTPEEPGIEKPHMDYVTKVSNDLGKELSKTDKQFQSFNQSLVVTEQQMISSMKEFAAASQAISDAILADSKNVYDAIHKRSAERVRQVDATVASNTKPDSWGSRFIQGGKDAAIPLATAAVMVLLQRRQGKQNEALIRQISSALGKEMPASASGMIQRFKNRVGGIYERGKTAYSESRLSSTGRANTRAEAEAALTSRSERYKVAKEAGKFEEVKKILAEGPISAKSTPKPKMTIAVANRQGFPAGPTRAEVNRAMREPTRPIFAALNPQGAQTSVLATGMEEPQIKLLQRAQKQGILIQENKLGDAFQLLKSKGTGSKAIKLTINELLKSGTAKQFPTFKAGGRLGKPAAAILGGLLTGGLLAGGMLAFGNRSAMAGQEDSSEIDGSQQGGGGQQLIGGGDVAQLGVDTLIYGAMMGRKGTPRLTTLRKGGAIALTGLVSSKVGEAIGGTTGEVVGGGLDIAGSALSFGKSGAMGAGISLVSELMRKNVTEKYLGYTAGAGQGMAGAALAGAAFGGPVGSVLGAGLYLGQEGMAVRAENTAAVSDQQMFDKINNMATAQVDTGSVSEDLQRTINRLTGRKNELTNRKEQDVQDSRGIYGKISTLFSKKQYTEESKKEFAILTRQIETLKRVQEGGKEAEMLAALNAIRDNLIKNATTTPEDKEKAEVTPINSQIKVDISVADTNNITPEMNEKVVKPLRDAIANLQSQLNDIINQSNPRPSQIAG